jgi:hypothetical protein
MLFFFATDKSATYFFVVDISETTNLIFHVADFIANIY